MSATARQKQLISILRRERFGSEEEYRDFLQDNFGKSSSTKLNKSEAGECSDLLKTGKKSTYYGAGCRGSQQRLTDEQAKRIAVLEAMLGWDKNRTRGFI